MELNYLNKSFSIFEKEISDKSKILNEIISQSSFLVLGGAGSIGQEVVKLIFKNNPKKIHVVDISENNLVELVRDIRSSFGYIDGDFSVYALDISSNQYDKFISNDGNYDYVLNLSALKHVRSEKDPYTLMRLIETNIFNVEKTIQHSISKGTKKYFSVSTDKATNPVNIMGASKSIMEKLILSKKKIFRVSTARFANVAFSNGSLLDGFVHRLKKQQPLSCPSDIKRFFVTPEQSGQICMLATFLGESGNIFFPKLDFHKDQVYFKNIALAFLKENGFEPVLVESEEKAKEFDFDNNSKNFGGGRTVDGKNRVIIYDFSLDKYSEYLSESLYKYDVRTPKEGLSEILSNKDLFVEDSFHARTLYFNADGSLRWSHVNLAKDNNVYRIGWSRILYRKEDINIVNNFLSTKMNCNE